MREKAETETEAIVRYHERSKHRPGRSAPGPGFMDWANQPDPFRTYEGAPVVELPLAGDDLRASWDDLHAPGAVTPRPLDRGALGAFLELALGLSAWKEVPGSRWALRANPSSGNLHPTEGYVLVPQLTGVLAGLYHYRSVDHVLERRFTPAAGAAP
ncbi:MAG: nitroreductase, partial [Planctomycetota bacterium]